MMKKTYIKPSINVLEMTEYEAILAASDGATGTGSYDGPGTVLDDMDEDKVKFNSVWDSDL